MRIGFDCDGVLADFNTAFAQVLETVSGRNLFGNADRSQPSCWDWPEQYGYTKQEIDKAWDTVHASQHFWRLLLPLEGINPLNNDLLQKNNDLYFITKRDSPTAKSQTELWLDLYTDIEYPTVLIAGDKGLACKALSLHAYIDDKPSNCLSVVDQSPRTKCYMLDARWNKHHEVQGAKRVYSVAEMLEEVVYGQVNARSL